MNPEELDQLQRMADGGDANAWYDLGLMYSSGDGVEQDVVRAVSCYAKACESGHLSAMNNLGVMYLNGNEVLEKNYASAGALIESAARQGEMNAMFNLGLIHENGWGVESNFLTAREWMERAQQAGHPDAHDAIERIRANDPNGSRPGAAAETAEPPPPAANIGPQPEGAYFRPFNPRLQRLKKAGAALMVCGGIGVGVTIIALIAAPHMAPWRIKVIKPGEQFTLAGSFKYYQGDTSKYTPLDSTTVNNLARSATWSSSPGISLVSQKVSGQTAVVSWKSGKTRHTINQGAEFSYTATFACSSDAQPGPYKLGMQLSGKDGRYLDTGSPSSHYVASSVNISPTLTGSLFARTKSLAMFGSWLPLFAGVFVLKRSVKKSREPAVVEQDEGILYQRIFNNSKTNEKIFDLGATQRAIYWNGDRIPINEIKRVLWAPQSNKLSIDHNEGHRYNLHLPLQTNKALIHEVAGEVLQVAKALNLPLEDKGR